MRTIVAIGIAGALGALVPILDEMVGEGMLKLEHVQIVSYRSSDE